MLRHLPNALTSLRLASAAPIAWLILAGDADWALCLFLLAALSDLFDGELAKSFGWTSQLGGWLDPLADKVLFVGTCSALALHGALPVWLFVLIVVRDAVIVGGALVFHFRFASLHAQPSWLGKLTTFLLFVTVLALLARDTRIGEWLWWLQPGPLVDGLFLVVAAMLVASGVDYVRQWAGKARQLRSA